MNIEQQKTHGKKRSSGWPAKRKAWLKKYPRCALCGGKEKITVHHIRPFHLHPELELDDTNFITLCEGKKVVNCHLVFGHFGNFRTKYNAVVKEAVNFWRPHLMSKEKMT